MDGLSAHWLMVGVWPAYTHTEDSGEAAPKKLAYPVVCACLFLHMSRGRDESGRSKRVADSMLSMFESVTLRPWP